MEGLPFTDRLATIEKGGDKNSHRISDVAAGGRGGHAHGRPLDHRAGRDPAGDL